MTTWTPVDPCATCKHWWHGAACADRGPMWTSPNGECRCPGAFADVPEAWITPTITTTPDEELTA